MTTKPALNVASQSASVSCRTKLPPEVLGEVLRTGTMPADYQQHIGALLGEASLLLLSRVATQLSADAALPVDQVWANMQALAAQLMITREISVPAMLKECHDRDSDDVKTGRRSARSLWAVQKGTLKDYTLTPSPASEYDKPGDGW